METIELSTVETRRRIPQQVIEDTVRQIVRQFQPQRIILFGSYAYGQPTPDSDVDLLIVLESDERPAARAMRVSRLLRPRPFPMDILVRTPDESLITWPSGCQSTLLVLYSCQTKAAVPVVLDKRIHRLPLAQSKLPLTCRSVCLRWAK